MPRRQWRRVGLCIALVFWSWQLRELVLSCMQAHERESCDAMFHQADVQSRGASPGADVGGVEPSPGADVGGVEPSPGADVGGVEPSPGADVQSKGADDGQPLATRGTPVVRLRGLWRIASPLASVGRDCQIIVSGQEALTFFLRINLKMETLAQVPCDICTGTGPTAATSAPGLGAPPPHLHWDWVCRCHISTGTWSTAPLC